MSEAESGNLDSMGIALSRSEWQTLQNLITGKPARRDHAALLRERGFFDDEALSDSAIFLLHGFLRSAGAVRIVMSDGGMPRKATMWVASDRAFLIEQQDDDNVVLRRQEAGMLPVAIVDALSIGPRPNLRRSSSLELPAETVTKVLEANDHESGESWEILAARVRPLWPEVCKAMIDGKWRCWLVQSYNVEETPARVRSTACVLDTAAGLLGISLRDGTAKLTPIGTLDLWTELSALFAPGS